MLIDHVRVYQSSNDDAHPGNPHTLGCDPPEYPTKEYIKGYSERYIRDKPFATDTEGPIIYDIVRGGGECEVNSDCGSEASTGSQEEEEEEEESFIKDGGDSGRGRGACVPTNLVTSIFRRSATMLAGTCRCNRGFTGPMCLAVDHVDESPSAYDIKTSPDLGMGMKFPLLPRFMLLSAAILVSIVLIALVTKVSDRRRVRSLGGGFGGGNHYAAAGNGNGRGAYPVSSGVHA